MIKKDNKMITILNNKNLNVKIKFKHPEKGCLNLLKRLENSDNMTDFIENLKQTKKRKMVWVSYDLSKANKNVLSEFIKLLTKGILL